MAGRIDKPFPDMHTLQEVIAAVQGLCLRNHGTRVSIGEIVQMFGPRSFAPLILAIGLIAVTPIDSIPTLPTTFGVIILLTVGQMLMGRQFLWLPKFIANRAVNADRLGSALDWLLPYARWADKRLGARLPMLTRGGVSASHSDVLRPLGCADAYDGTCAAGFDPAGAGIRVVRDRLADA